MSLSAVFKTQVYGKAGRGLYRNGYSKRMAYPHCCLVTQKLQSTYFNVLYAEYAYFIRWALVSPDGVAPSRMVSMSASVNLPLHHKVQKFLLAPAQPGGPGKGP